MRNIIPEIWLSIDFIFFTGISDDYYCVKFIERPYDFRWKTFVGSDIDIITFDYSEGDTLSGDIFISIDRVTENAKEYKVKREEELLRVMAHGILHLCGLNDESEEEKLEMKKNEDRAIERFYQFQKDN